MKFIKYFILILINILVLLLPMFVLYSFFKNKKDKIAIKCNLNQIAQYYFFSFLFNRHIKKNSIMIHAVSMGEIDAAINLIKSFKRKNKDRIILTVTSIQGYEKVIKNQKDICVYYFPFDSVFHQLLFIKHFNIKKAIIIEHDFWPNFLACMELLENEVILLNAYLSNKTINRLKNSMYREFFFNPINKICTQTEELKQKILKIMPTINVNVAPSYKLPLKNVNIYSDSILLNRNLITISNFHPVETDVLLRIISYLLNKGFKVALIPRHINIFEKLIKHLKVKYEKDFMIIEDSLDPIKLVNDEKKLFFIKKYGILEQFYKISLATIVCGTFDSTLKGHSIFEPMLCGSMTFYGPCFTSQMYMHEILERIMADMVHDPYEICMNINSLTNQQRITIYGKFVEEINKEKVYLTRHFEEVEKWIED
ncbi:glycosyltransferase N-terminal domain-containing protein [Xenorhabdus khoisanae]|uniref:3-deoxy-D-manno-octulosonic acid transferase n=1 Tax=Xenorhabdus khoisanae TaxID=880157 RepID=UPI0032B83AD3